MNDQAASGEIDRRRGAACGFVLSLAVLLSCLAPGCRTAPERYVPDGDLLSSGGRQSYVRAADAAAQGRRDRAIRLLEGVASDSPAHVPTRLLLQDLELLRDGPEITLSGAVAAAERAPEDWIAKLLLARLDRDPRVRLVAYREIARQHPGQAWAHLAVVDAALEVSLLAGDEVREAERRGTLEDRRKMSDALAERDGTLEEARLSVDRALVRRPALVPAIRRRGDLLGVAADREQNGDVRRRLIERRLAAYDEALRIAPEDIPTLVARATVHQLRNDYVAAQRDLTRATELRPWDPDLHQNLGVVAYEMGQLALAEKSFRRAVELDPRSVESLRNLGDTRAAREKWDEAEDAYEKALRFRPEAPDLLERLGNLSRQQGRYDRAIEFYRRYLATDGPDRARVEAAMRRVEKGSR